MQRNLFVLTVSLFVGALASVAAAASSFAHTVHRFARETLDLFKPEPLSFREPLPAGPRVTTGQPLAPSLLQSLRHESPAGWAASR